MKGRAEVIRINLMGQIGRTLVGRYGVRASPTMLVFDGKGNVIYSQAGIPNSEAILQAVNDAAWQ